MTRFLSTLAVLVVAVIAATVSYTHIETLALVHGQTETAARLLPLSVDGLILAASLVLLQAAGNKQQAPALSRFALWLGIGARWPRTSPTASRTGPSARSCRRGRAWRSCSRRRSSWGR
jgi:uncharacterized protein DUF2637